MYTESIFKTDFYLGRGTNGRHILLGLAVFLATGLTSSGNVINTDHKSNPEDNAHRKLLPQTHLPHEYTHYCVLSLCLPSIKKF